MGFKALVFIYITYILIFSLGSSKGQKETYLEVLDVGQGDALYIHTREGYKILIDGGGGWDVDGYLPYTWPIQPCVLDLVVLTHPHSDHSVGIERVSRRCRVKRYLYFPEVSMNDELRFGSLQFQVLWPRNGYVSTDKNNESLVILLTYKGTEVLLTGDVDGEILCSLENIPLHPDILKVSHHGSITGLCERIIPDVAVISVGSENKYGHPDPEVLKFYEDNKVPIQRTDLDGTIRFRLPL